KLRQSERVRNARQARQFSEQDLGFCAREFVMCGLPFKRPSTSTYERKNGDIRLRVIGDPKLGVPFGQDRLIPIWLASAFQAAGKPKDDRIYFRSASDILRVFDLPIDGHEVQLLRERIGRIFGATYIMETEGKKLGAPLVKGHRYQLIRQMQLWFPNRVR